MSIIFSLLLLLGFSLHACDARALGGAVAHHSITKLNPGARVSIESRPNDANEDDHESDNDVDEVKRRESEPVASVGWKVPHRKKGEAEPGFNLDYLPPKTHPPVHN